MITLSQKINEALDKKSKKLSKYLIGFLKEFDGDNKLCILRELIKLILTDVNFSEDKTQIDTIFSKVKFTEIETLNSLTGKKMKTSLKRYIELINYNVMDISKMCDWNVNILYDGVSDFLIKTSEPKLASEILKLKK